MAVKLFLIFATAASFASTFNIDRQLNNHWTQFKVNHKKKYEDKEEEHHRRNIFAKNHQLIEEHNRKFQEGKVSYKLAMNKYGDLDRHEFNNLMNGYKGDVRTLKHIGPPRQSLKSSTDAVDYRKNGAVSPVKDQGLCQSCWAFSATGALESAYFLNMGKPVSLSEQNLIDCSWDYGNYGCEGGVIQAAFQYVVDNDGIDTEQSYPYLSKDGDACHFNRSDVGCTEARFDVIPFGDDEALENTLCNVGPVSVAIDADHFGFQFYSSGVYEEPDCDDLHVNHALLAVGYDTEDGTGKKYWIAKNSWGESFGIDGYIYISRDQKNHCGISSLASYPIL